MYGNPYDKSSHCVDLNYKKDHLYTNLDIIKRNAGDNKMLQKW